MAVVDRYAIGLTYTTALTVTPLLPKDPQNKPLVTEKVYLDGVDLSYIDSGPIEVSLANVRTGRSTKRIVRSDFGSALGLIPTSTPSLPQDRVLTETGRRYLNLRGKAEDVLVTISSSTPLDLRLAAISQTGTVIPI